MGFIGTGFGRIRRNSALYNGGYHIFPVLEIDTEDIETEGVYGAAAKSIDVRAG